MMETANHYRGKLAGLSRRGRVAVLEPGYLEELRSNYHAAKAIETSRKMLDKLPPLTDLQLQELRGLVADVEQRSIAPQSSDAQGPQGNR